MRKLSAKFTKGDSGFTLIELLVVIIILGILSSIAVVAVNNARDKAVLASCKEDAVNQLKALDNYYLDNGGYPTLTAGAVPSASLVPAYLHNLGPQVGSSATPAPAYFLKTTLSGSTPPVASVHGYANSAGSTELTAGVCSAG